MSDSGRILKLTVENFKGVEFAEVDTRGAAMVHVTGRNGAGKSSILDSIVAVLGGTRVIDAEPVRHGAETAQIIATFADGTVLRRNWTANGNSYLKVTTADGAVVANGQTWLDQRVNAVAFDPFAWIRKPVREQFGQLCEMTGLRVDELVAKRKAAYDQRTEVNREVKAAEQHVADLADDFSDLPEEMTGFEDIKARLVEARAADQQRQSLLQQTEGHNIQAQHRRDKIAELEVLLEHERAALAESIEDAAECARQMAAITVPDIGTIEAQLEQAAELNQRIAQRRSHAQAVRELVEVQAKAAELTQTITDIDEDRRCALAEADWPVDDLSVEPEEGVVTWRGRPLAQASQAEQLSVAIGIAARLNKQVRVVLIREASLCDPQTIAMLREQAVKLDAQLWLEEVGPGGLELRVDDVVATDVFAGQEVL